MIFEQSLLWSSRLVTKKLTTLADLGDFYQGKLNGYSIVKMVGIGANNERGYRVNRISIFFWVARSTFRDLLFEIYF